MMPSVCVAESCDLKLEVGLVPQQASSNSSSRDLTQSADGRAR